MTDMAIDRFMKGKMEIGGTGGFALGKWGLGVACAGGASGGLEEVVVTANQGAFLGGGWTDIQPQPANVINDDIYGPNADLHAILMAPGGRFAPANPVRARLSQMVVEAWDTSSKPPEKSTQTN
jgi:hypothetical protein